jgi:hypothetical protein
MSTVTLSAAPEQQIARDMMRRALPLAPVAVGICALIWGAAGAISALLALGIVLVNFAAASWLMATAARINEAMLMATVLFGYLLRLAVIAAVVLAVRNQSWIEPMALGLTLVVSHLGLLIWELRYVSASLAFPGLKPGATKDLVRR